MPLNDGADLIRVMLGSLNNAYSKRSANMFSLGGNDYPAAIAALNSLQSNKQVLADRRTTKYPSQALSTVVRFLSRSGLEVQDLENKLSVIHVSGTKGKGSTCAYCESILRHYGYKTGFFSSPHLVSVRERIRIDGQPISRQKFSSYFWNIYRKLEQSKKVEENVPVMPPYFMFLTLMAFKVFAEENVDVAILEVGIGGEYDCTNVFQSAAVVGITSLGYDHVNLLGNTIEEIAWQKAGILKPGAIAITAANQPIAALEVLLERAVEKKCSIFVAPELTDYSCEEEIRLGIRSPVQSVNASLAIQLANAWMNPHCYTNENGSVRRAPVFSLSKEILQGLDDCHWPGRTQLFRRSPSLIYYLDGAHNTESIQYCSSWFQQMTSSSTMWKKVLIFNMIGNRDANELLTFLLPCQFDFVFFCTNRIEKVKQDVDLSADNWSPVEDEEDRRARSYYDIWMKMNPSGNENNTRIFASVIEAHEFLENLSSSNQLHVLVTGSLHLVGAFLSVLDPELKHKSYQIRKPIQAQSS